MTSDLKGGEWWGTYNHTILPLMGTLQTLSGCLQWRPMGINRSRHGAAGGKGCPGVHTSCRLNPTVPPGFAAGTGSSTGSGGLGNSALQAKAPRADLPSLPQVTHVGREPHKCRGAEGESVGWDLAAPQILHPGAIRQPPSTPRTNTQALGTFFRGGL